MKNRHQETAVLIAPWYLFYLNFDGQRLTDAEIEADLRRMAQSGMRQVYLTLLWADVSAGPGRYRLELADRIMRRAQHHGLGVIIGLIVDTAPPWAFRRHPDARYVSDRGEVLDDRGGRELPGAPGLCFDAPGVRAEILRFYRDAVRRLGRHPALTAWDVWPEIWSDPTICPNYAETNVCYCAHTIRRFQRWAKARYGNLDALRRVWGVGFERWIDVMPPRHGRRPVPAWLDWKRFAYENQARRLADLAQAVRAIDPRRPIIAHAALSSVASRGRGVLGSFPISTLSDDWRMAGHVDMFGLSLYACTPESEIRAFESKEVLPSAAATAAELKHARMDLDVARNLDGIRCAAAAHGKPFLIAELPGRQAGDLFTPTSDPLYIESQALWMWMALARKASGILVYEWRGITESLFAPGWGLCDTEGEPTARAEGFVQAVRQMERIEPWLTRAEPVPAGIGILFNPLAYTYDWLQRKTWARESVLGYYKAFWRRNYLVDFVHPDQLSRPLPYRVLVVPYPIAMDQATLEGLERFVQRGGRLVTEALFAAKDEVGDLRRRGSLRRWSALLGCELADVRPPECFRVSGRDPAFGSAIRGESLPAAVCTQTLRPLTGATVAAAYSDGTPAAVRTRRTLVFGSFLGQAYTEQDDPRLEQLIGDIAQWAGVRPAVRVGRLPAGAQLEARVLEGPDYALVFLMNHGFRALRPRIRLDMPTRRRAARDLLQGQRLAVSRDGALLTGAAVPRRSAAVLLLR